MILSQHWRNKKRLIRFSWRKFKMIVEMKYCGQCGQMEQTVNQYCSACQGQLYAVRMEENKC